MIKSYFSGERVVSASQEAFSLYERSRFGEKRNRKIEYSNVEVLFLFYNGRVKVFSGDKELDEESLLRRLRRVDKKIEVKYAVFSDLRKKGYIVKTALKFGAEFRVYEKGIKPGGEHSKWVLGVVKESEILNLHEFAAKNRIAHSTKKKLLLGIVDEEGDVSYYEIGWKKL